MITKNKVLSVSYELKTEPDGGKMCIRDSNIVDRIQTNCL